MEQTSTVEQRGLDVHDAREPYGQLEKCREMLLIGLASYGEIERLDGAQRVEVASGREIPKKLRVIHPTGSDETLGDFAAALRDVEFVIRTICDLAQLGRPLVLDEASTSEA